MGKRNAKTPLRDRLRAFIRRRQWSRFSSFTRDEVNAALCATDAELIDLLGEFSKDGLIKWDREIRAWRVQPCK